MRSDLDIQRSIEAGQRNLEAKALIQNWCGHARVEKFGGTGLIEIETGLPIGHLSMVCDHARGGGVATWLLEESAIHFHDSHCVNCSMRKPLRLPNISKLIERRDRDAVLERIRNEELQQQQQAAFDARCAAITALRTKSPVAVATFLDDLQAFDVKRDEALAHKLIESARLAPELLTEEITEHLFSLLESGELWFDAVGLSILGVVHASPVRLAHCAMLCLAGGRILGKAAELAANNVTYIAVEDVRPTVGGLAYVSCPPRSFFGDDEPRQENPVPLLRIYAQFPAEIALGIEDLLSEQHPFPVRMGARAVVALAAERPEFPIGLRRSLAAKLVRVEKLLDIDRESDLRDLVHDLTKALICAFMSDPIGTDSELMRYFEGASKEGEARLSGIYERIIREGVGGYRNREEIVQLAPYRVALRRLIALATTSENEDVVQDMLEALRSDPDRLASLAREQMDTLLGAAALADSKLVAWVERSSPLIAPADLLSAMEQDNRRWRLTTLRASFIRWAVHGAAVDPSGLAALTEFLDKSNTLSEHLYAAIIEELTPLLDTGAGLSAALPFLYTAMVGKSNWIRAAAAKAIGEINYRRFDELPGLVAEAFLLMLFDPYVVVHKSAVRALRRVSLPKEFKSSASVALQQLILAYRGENDQEFLLTCMEAYTSGKNDNEQFKIQLGKVFIAILGEVEPELLMARDHQWLLRRLSDVEGYAELVLGLFEQSHSEYETEHVLELVREIPTGTTGQHAAAIKRAAESSPSDPMLIGTFLEVLTRDSEWVVALEVAQLQLDAVPDTTRMRVLQLMALQQRCRAEFELLISQGDVDAALAIGKTWDTASEEINQIREQNEKTDPFRSILRTS